LNGKEVLNGARLTLLPPSKGRRILDCVKRPLFLCDQSHGRVKDFEGYSGFWLVSEKMKMVVESIDAEALDFLLCDVRSSDGQECAPRWLCDVTRFLDALDEKESKVGIGTADDGSKVYRILGGEKLVFRSELVGQVEI
jgi:Protein of unknown function (DUF1629)